MMKRRRLTKQFILDAARYVKAGVPLDVTARLLLPVKEADEFFRWLAIGSDPNVEPQLLRRRIYKDFAAAIDRASAECEARHALVVQKGGAKWSAWWLSRRHPSRWGDRAVLEVQTPAMLTERRAAWDARIAEIKGRSFDPRALPEGAPPFDAPLAERLAYLRANTPDPRAEHVEPAEVITSTTEERTTIVTAPPLTGGYLDVTPPESH